VQLLLANHVDHDVSDSLVAVQLDVSHAFCSVARQPQFDVLASKASRPYDDGRVQVGDELPRPRTLDKYWGYFLSMQGNASTMRFSENQGVTQPLFLASLRFCVHYCIDRDTVQKKKTALCAVFLS